MPVARDSDAVAFDMDIMKPTPCATSSFTIGQAPFAVPISSRVFAAACSFVVRWESLRNSFHSATSRSAAETTWSGGTLRMSAARRRSSLCFRIASSAPLPAAYSSRTTPSWMRVDRRILIRDTSLVRGLVGPRLPDVVAEDLARCAEDDVRRGVVPHQGLPAFPVDHAGHAGLQERGGIAAHEV